MLNFKNLKATRSFIAVIKEYGDTEIKDKLIAFSQLRTIRFLAVMFLQLALINRQIKLR